MLVNLRREPPPGGRSIAPVRASVYPHMQRGTLMMRLSIRQFIAEEFGLQDGDRVEVKFGFGPDEGEILIIKAAAQNDQFSYRVCKRSGSNDVAINLSLLPDWLCAQRTTPCLHRYGDAALQITLPATFINAAQ